MCVTCVLQQHSNLLAAILLLIMAAALGGKGAFILVALAIINFIIWMSLQLKAVVDNFNRKKTTAVAVEEKRPCPCQAQVL